MINIDDAQRKSFLLKFALLAVSRVSRYPRIFKSATHFSPFRFELFLMRLIHGMSFFKNAISQSVPLQDLPNNLLIMLLFLLSGIYNE